MEKIVKNWPLPFILALGLFLITQPILVRAFEPGVESQAPEEVGIEVVDGYSQVYYLLDGEKTFITDTRQNSSQVVTNGEYITWSKMINGRGQIFVYYIPSSTTTQLTFVGTNINPQVSEQGRVVWEGWVDPPDAEASWQIFLFDGTRIAQLTKGDVSINPSIEAGYIIFSRKDVGGTWRAVVYSISQDEFKDVSLGTNTKRPILQLGKIILDNETFPLTVDDLFLLDLPPLVTDEPETTSEQEILEELEAEPDETLPSGATSSATYEEGTPSGQIGP
jgi:hypothetical protein